jgi:hypothetical protein
MDLISAALLPLLQSHFGWHMETLFKALKSQGFNFEDTHLSDLDRIAKLLEFLTI